MSSRSKVLTWGLPIVGAGALAMGTGLVIENRPVRPQEDPPRQPTTAPSVAEGVEASAYIGAIGTTEPAGEPIAIAAHTSGVVSAVHVAVGDAISMNAPLFTVDTSRAEADVALRETEVVVAESERTSLRADIPPLRAAVRSAQAALSSALAEVQVAESDLGDRQNQLRIAEAVSDPRAIAAEQVDTRRFAVTQAEARVSTANAAVEQAEARVAEAEAELARLVDPATDGDGPDLRAASARVEQARRALARAQTDLDLLGVRSPIEGRVLQVNIRPGEFAPASVPSEGLLVLGRGGPLHLRVEIDEVDIPRFSTDARAWASPRGEADTRIELELVNVEPLVVPKRNLAGRTSELIDTRVLQVVYSLGDGFESPGIGQQFDVYIEIEGEGS
ncbi:MAG: HlyD family efflux transporter periplasmic adaptor subunit [Planctomycetota bacterium]